jgi:hypothetical protein
MRLVKSVICVILIVALFVGVPLNAGAVDLRIFTNFFNLFFGVVEGVAGDIPVTIRFRVVNCLLTEIIISFGIM